MTCLLHIRTTTAASPNTKRKERSEDLEEQNTVVDFQIQSGMETSRSRGQ